MFISKMEDASHVDTKNAQPPEDKGKEKQQAYECNICFDDVVDPVVTRCGHLFCWACILTWMNRPNEHCPVCHAGISKENVIPLYGRGQQETDPRTKTSEPRPKAERPEPSQQDSRRSSFFGGMTVAMFAIPFSIVLPIPLTGSGRVVPFSFTNIMNTDNVTPEERRARINSAILMTMGLAIIAYIVFVL